MRTISDLRKASSVTVNSYLLFLARADKRRGRMRRTLAEAGIKAEFVEAVDVETTSKEYLLSSCKSDGPWGVFQLGNMACTISHALAWERFLASDAQYAAIFEDDIFISPELQLWLQDMGWWPEDCALVRLEFWCSRTLRVILGTRAQTHLGRKIAPLLSRNPGSAGYIVNREGAHRLLEVQPYDVTIDTLLFNPMVSRLATDLGPHQISPALIKQGNTPPDQASVIAGARYPLSGKAYWRQKFKRGGAELRATPLHLARILTGQAQMRRVVFQDRTVDEPTRHWPCT